MKLIWEEVEVLLVATTGKVAKVNGVVGGVAPGTNPKTIVICPVEFASCTVVIGNTTVPSWEPVTIGPDKFILVLSKSRSTRAKVRGYEFGFKLTVTVDGEVVVTAFVLAERVKSTWFAPAALGGVGVFLLLRLKLNGRATARTATIANLAQWSRISFCIGECGLAGAGNGGGLFSIV